MSSKKPPRGRTADSLEIGGIPRVDLLPPEVRAQAAVKKVRGRAFLAVVVGIAVVVIATGAAFYASVNAEAKLLAERQQTQVLLAEQQKYAEVQQVEVATAAVRNAQTIGAWTEVDWREYLSKVQATLPAGTTIQTVAVDSASATEIYPQASVPLQGSRIATITFTATTGDLPQVPAWLDALSTLPGFVDAVPSTVSAIEGGGYSVSMIMHVGDAAYSGRFLPEPSATEPSTTDADAETTTAASGDATSDGGN